MKRAAALSLLACAQAVSPMEKVFSMLVDLQSKVQEDGKAAVEAYDNYTKFCVRGKRDFGYDIQDGAKTVEELSAAIEKASAEMEVSGSRLEELQGAISKSEADQKAAADLRSKEQAQHAAARTELEDASDMLGRAIKTLSEKLPGSALLQETKAENLVQALGAVVDAAAFPNGEKQSLMAFVESATQQPEVAAYKSKSGGILSVLEDMKAKARDDLNSMVSQEKKAQHSFLMLKQSLEMQISADQKETDQAKAVRSEAAEAKAAAEAALDGSKKDLANDKTSLQQLEASCSQAAEDFEESAKGRAEELEALKKAEEVLKEKTGGAEAGVYKGSVLLQVNAHSQGQDAPVNTFEVVKMVRTLARKSESTGLETLAANIESLLQTRQAPSDVFAKVKELIQNMITSRKEEAAADETKKAYCEEEQTKTKAKVEELSSQKDKLSAKTDKKSSESETLKSEAAALQRELAELKQLQIEMDATRTEEKAAFEKQQTDLQAGLEGVRSALSVLRDYYESSGAALIQQPVFAYKKSTSSGVLGMLEVVESDFGRSLAQAETVEATKAEEYESMTKQNDLTKVQKDADQKFKAKTAASLDKAVLDLGADAEASKEELAAVLTYQESLAKQCYDGGMSYAERAAKREEEIQGLKDALASLGGTDLNAVLLQKGLRG
eukprot:CAMPEP_0181486298 /NCGR_PEP_ID=MMETSP1110-20121109/47062_1 /TAXON_ID=174948 /ORGANISM="Symbiodinium sp., Strain CCMP421" /LENGTH=667 /DNA_ID=CAMNT_0023612431 /DNA_START=56 /DNA_END=2055 /DNA_ORIENTATION=+